MENSQYGEQLKEKLRLSEAELRQPRLSCPRAQCAACLVSEQRAMDESETCTAAGAPLARRIRRMRNVTKCCSNVTKIESNVGGNLFGSQEVQKMKFAGIRDNCYANFSQKCRR